jgi:hypothetical protein
MDSPFARIAPPRPAAPGSDGGWWVRILRCDGAVATETRLGDGVGAVQVTNPRFGTWTVDHGPNGYVQPHVREVAGGGSVVVPYVLTARPCELLIGVLEVTRALVGAGRAPVRELPRGFTAAALCESHARAAAREVREETGIAEQVTARLEELPGDPVNVNTAYFASDPSQGEGVHFYALPFAATELALSHDSSGLIGRLLPHMADGVRELHEKIRPSGLVFVPVMEAIESTDGFTRSAVGTLLVHLLRQGVLSVNAELAGGRACAPSRRGERPGSTAGQQGDVCAPGPK